MQPNDGKEFLDHYVRERLSVLPKEFEEGADLPSFTNDHSGTAAAPWRNPLG